MDLIYASQFNGRNEDGVHADAWGMDFPSVNDLDVAAAAAAAALEVLAPSTGLAAPPLPPSFTNKLVSLNMWVDGDHIVASVDPVHVEESDEDEMSTSEDESVHDLDEIHDMIDRALNEDEDEDGLVKGSTSAAHDLGLPDQPLPMDGVSVLADDVLEPAGVVLSVFDGMVVVQGLEGPKALDESSVLCMEDRTIIGRIEEVFGPVAKPLYALRFAGKESALSSTQPGSKIFSVPRLCGFIPLDDLKAYRDRKGGEGLGGDDADEEEYFSDDDEEEAFTKVRSKRKADAIQTPAPNEARTSNVPRLRSTTPASHAAYHQPRSSSHFKAFATAGQMQSVSLSDGRSSEGRSRQGSIMSSQYAPPAQSSYQNGQNHSQMPYMMPQPFAPGSFVPTGYGTAPYHAAPPTMPPTQYLSVQHPLQPPHNSQYPRM